MTMIDALKEDYAKFPKQQSYDLYAEDVYFEDPLNKFRGVQRYRKMIQFIQTWFIDTQMEVHDIQQQGDEITTRWTLRWQAPFPWKPRMEIPGRSELQLNEAGLICSHIDYWDCSRLDVLKQALSFRSSNI
ncbi:MAG: DUF2358 domain-containing protein [Cyanobacteria bacterium P01_A01_bin.17]